MRSIHMPPLLFAMTALSPAHAEDRPAPPAADGPAASAPAIAVPPIVLPSPLVISAIPGMPPVDNKNGTTNTPFLQISGNEAGNTGYLEFMYGANGKGVFNTIVKTRGTAMNTYAAVQSGDRMMTTMLQAGSGGQAGHAGTEEWTVDGSNIVDGEVNGRWSVATGVGRSYGPAQQTPFPYRYGVRNAIIANTFQQVYLPGGVVGPAGDMPSGSNFGGWLVIGAGASAPGFGPLKFLTAGAVALARPEPGAFEVDAGGTPYFTRGDGVRRAFALTDTAAPGVAPGAAAGNGASASVDAGGAAGTVTLVTGASPTQGNVVTLTYAHPYATASYPVVSPANAAAAGVHFYATGTASGFTLGATGALAANTTYRITYQVAGR